MDQEISSKAAHLPLSSKAQEAEFIKNRADATLRRRKANRWVIGCAATAIAGIGYIFTTSLKHEKAIDAIMKGATVVAVAYGVKKMNDAQYAHDEAVENDRALVDLTGDVTQAQFDATCIDVFDEHHGGIAKTKPIPFTPGAA